MLKLTEMTYRLSDEWIEFIEEEGEERCTSHSLMWLIVMLCGGNDANMENVLEVLDEWERRTIAYTELDFQGDWTKELIDELRVVAFEKMTGLES